MSKLMDIVAKVRAWPSPRPVLGLAGLTAGSYAWLLAGDPTAWKAAGFVVSLVVLASSASVVLPVWLVVPTMTATTAIVVMVSVSEAARRPDYTGIEPIAIPLLTGAVFVGSTLVAGLAAIARRRLDVARPARG